MAIRGRKPQHPVDVHVGRRVKIQRVLQGMSQTAFAGQLGITFQQLQKYETGFNRISASRLWTIAQALDVPVEWFFKGLDGAPDETPTVARRETLEMARYYEACPANGRKAIRALAMMLAEKESDTTVRAPAAAE